MRVARLVLSAVLSALFLNSSDAQQTASSSTQASQLMQQSLAALQGNTSISDITLTGTARRIAGSDDESGTGVLKGLASGAGRTDLSLSSGQRSEVINTSVTPSAGTWSGPDGISHAMAFHNLLTGPAWFFPAFAIAPRLSASGYIATYIGHETHNGQAVEHVSVSQAPPLSTSSGVVSLGHLSQVDFFLNSATFLPISIAFNIHPDNNAGLDLPVEIRFSDYTSVSGAQVPYHVQKYLNNSLILDFQATSVTLNSGLSLSAFNAQ